MRVLGAKVVHYEGYYAVGAAWFETPINTFPRHLLFIKSHRGRTSKIPVRGGAAPQDYPPKSFLDPRLISEAKPKAVICTFAP